jgi:hypothetical protein
MSEPLHDALKRFMSVASEKIKALRDENRSLASQVSDLRGQLSSLETRSAPPVAGPQGEPGPSGEPGPAGVGVAGFAVRQMDGHLIARFTDGTEQDVGFCRGDPGPQGERGADGRVGADGPQGPAGERGERGTDGIATREELEAIIEERFADLQIRSLADWYQGVFRADGSYERGHLVQWDGSLFLAQKRTSATPLDGPDWKLVTKKGRDGRDRR